MMTIWSHGRAGASNRHLTETGSYNTAHRRLYWTRLFMSTPRQRGRDRPVRRLARPGVVQI